MILLPQPRKVIPADGYCNLQGHKRIALDATTAKSCVFSAKRLQVALLDRTGIFWEITTVPLLRKEDIGVALHIEPWNPGREQGYQLAVTVKGIDIRGHDQAGLFYGLCTLIQLVDQFGAYIPCMKIIDWPDFRVRGVMLDISRDKVPTQQTLYDLVDMLAGWKVNHLQLYMVHTFAYSKHPLVWANASPFTPQEVRELEAYCRDRYIDLVPYQASFGHMMRWIKHEKYRHLAEMAAPLDPASSNNDWINDSVGDMCPEDPHSIELLRDLYGELLPCFSSNLFNVGCDETFDLGKGRSKTACEQKGKGTVYLEFLLKIYQEVNSHGKTMLYWSDIVFQYPHLFPLLPKDAIVMDWGYHPYTQFDKKGAALRENGIPFYVCPGTSSWLSIGGRTDYSIANLLNAASAGLRQGALGYLNTDWGDHGHWQMLPVSYTGFAVGAAYSWALEANKSLDIPQAVGIHAFKDLSGRMGHVAYDLGNVGRILELISVSNETTLFKLLTRPLEWIRAASAKKDKMVGVDFLELTMRQIECSMRLMCSSQMKRSDAALVLRELTLTSRMLRHACLRAKFALVPSKRLQSDLVSDIDEILIAFKSVWLERNRPGGLSDSLRKLHHIRKEYPSR